MPFLLETTIERVTGGPSETVVGGKGKRRTALDYQNEQSFSYVDLMLWYNSLISNMNCPLILNMNFALVNY